MDIAIISRTKLEEEENKDQLGDLELFTRRLDELPFDFERRRMSVVVEDRNGKTQMITKAP